MSAPSNKTPFVRGAKYGQWEAIAEADASTRGEQRWLCRCSCGAEKVQYVGQLRAGQSLKCRRCEDAIQAERLRGPENRAHAKTLTAAIWERVCLTCGTPFAGTARQQYCGKACRPPNIRPKCRDCPNPAAKGHTKCRACRKKDRERVKTGEAERMAAGTCRQCDSPPLPGLTRCQRHHDMQRAAWERSNAKKLAGYHERQAGRRKKAD